MKSWIVTWSSLIVLVFGVPGASFADELTLQQARDLARKNSPTIQLAKEKLYQTEMMIDKAWVMLKPQLNATGTYTHTEPDAKIAFPDFDSMFGAIVMDPNICGDNPVCVDWSKVKVNETNIVKTDSFGFTATLMQPLFNARAYTTIKQAYDGYDLAKINTTNLEDYLLYSVDVAYYSALTAKKFVTAARKAVDLRREHLKVAKAKFEVGDQPKITVLKAEIDLNRSEQDVKTAENSLDQAKEALALIMGRDSNFDLVEPGLSAAPEESLDSLIEKALGKRRDLQIAELNLNIADRSKTDAWYRFLPSLNLTGMFHASDTKGFTGEYYTWNIGLSLSLPLYDGGLRYAELHEAESKIREAQINIKNTKLQIRSEIRQLWLNMKSTEANLTKARKALELAEEQAQLSKVSFEAGAITNLEVLDANHTVFLAEVNVAQLEFQFQLAVMKLKNAMVMFNPAGVSSSGIQSQAAASSGSMSQGSPPPSGSSGAAISSSAQSQSLGSGGMPVGR